MMTYFCLSDSVLIIFFARLVNLQADGGENILCVGSLHFVNITDGLALSLGTAEHA